MVEEVCIYNPGFYLGDNLQTSFSKGCLEIDDTTMYEVQCRYNEFYSIKTTQRYVQTKPGFFPIDHGYGNMGCRVFKRGIQT